jgi:hypothetical protein
LSWTSAYAPGDWDRRTCVSADLPPCYEPTGCIKQGEKANGAASDMPDGSEPLRTRPVFHAVIQVMLDDGELTREEQRLAIKLGTLLFKQEKELREQPALIYKSVVDGREVEGGRIIGRGERLQIFREMFETAFMNSSLSQDELAAIAMLRSALDIDESEYELLIEIVERSIEESVEPKLFDKVKEDLASVLDKVGGMFDSIIR